MGELMRRYWHPIAAVPDLNERPTKSVRLLGEDLVLYRDKSGTYGLIDRFCPHRRVDLSYGIPEEHGLRCMYHGWMMDETGQCIEQPFEETVHPDGRFKEKVKIAGYPVEACGGLIFAYLGPSPAPLLPRWEWLVEEHAFRQVNFLGASVQLAPVPGELARPDAPRMAPHNYWGNYQRELSGDADSTQRPHLRHQKIGFDVFDYGIIKKRVFTGYTEEDGDWAVGHPVLFPNILSNPSQFRVPIDDTHTLHVDYISRKLSPDMPRPASRGDRGLPPALGRGGRAPYRQLHVRPGLHGLGQPGADLRSATARSWESRTRGSFSSASSSRSRWPSCRTAASR